MMDDLTDFEEKMKDIGDSLRKIYAPFEDYEMSCETIHATLGGGLAAGAILSFIPGDFLTNMYL